MNRVLTALCVLVLASSPAFGASSAQDEIKSLTSKFCEAIVAGDLSVVDKMFDAAPSHVFYDINEGPLVGLERLKRVWGAAIRDSRLKSFTFTDDLQIELDGDRALQTGSWVQTQAQPDGSIREIQGRATILWHNTADGWKVYHYHASVTPPRRPRQ